MRTLCVMFLISAFAFPLSASEKAIPHVMPLDKQEEAERLDRAISTLNELDALFTATVQQKRHHCMKAVGDPVWCECISMKGPVGVGFTQYIHILSSTKEELKYDQLSSEEKRIVDTARLARDQCVNLQKSN